MSKVRIELNSAGVRAVLKSAEIGSLCMSAANKVAQRAGNGFAVQSRNYKERTGAAVFPETYEAYRAVMQDNALLRSL